MAAEQMTEALRFPPPPEFAENALIGSMEQYRDVTTAR